MTGGETPYAALPTNDEVMSKSGVPSPTTRERLQRCVLLIMQRCWDATPTNRPSFETLAIEFRRIANTAGLPAINVGLSKFLAADTDGGGMLSLAEEAHMA